VQGHPSQKLSESQAKRATALKSALGPLMEVLTDDLIVEVTLDADGAVRVEKVGAGMLRTGVRMAPADAERMLRLSASEMSVELTTSSLSLAGKLPAPLGRSRASLDSSQRPATASRRMKRSSLGGRRGSAISVGASGNPWSLSLVRRGGSA
jgi:Flp pilus assembly CpaF family ATPase